MPGRPCGCGCFCYKLLCCLSNATNITPVSQKTSQKQQLTCFVSFPLIISFIIFDLLLNFLEGFFFFSIKFYSLKDEARKIDELFKQVNIPVYDHLQCNHLWSEARTVFQPKALVSQVDKSFHQLMKSKMYG